MSLSLIHDQYLDWLLNILFTTIKKDGNITSEIISEIPIFEGYQDYRNVNRSNKIRYV